MATHLRSPLKPRLGLIGLACATMLTTGDLRGDEAAWPQFRGPDCVWARRGVHGV